jgi:hypothetical protein
MRRINHVLRHLSRQKSWQELQCYDTERIDDVMAEWQRTYDRLCGVPGDHPEHRLPPGAMRMGDGLKHCR